MIYSSIPYILAGLFFILALMLPNHYMPWLSVYQETSMILALVTLTIAISLSLLKIPKIFSLFLAIACIPIIQYFFKIIYYRQDAFIGAAYLFLFWLAVVIGFNLIGQRSTNATYTLAKEPILKYILNALIFIAIIQVWIAMRQWMLFDGNIWTVDIPIGARPFGNFGQPNHLSTLLCMGLIGTLFNYEYKQLNKYTASLLGVFLLIGVALTQSRTAWVVATAFIIWWGVKGRNIGLKLSFKYLLAWIGGYIAFLFLIPQISRYLGLSSFDVSQRLTAGYERLTMWQQVVYAIQKEPFFGYGWGQLRLGLIQTTDFANAKNFESSHNLFLDLIIWNGLPIGTVIIGCIFWILIKLFLIKIEKMAFLLLACSIPIFIHSLLEYPLSYAYFLLPFGLILGMAYSVICQKQNHPTYQVSIYIKVLSVGVITLILAMFIYEYIHINARYQQLRYETAKFTKEIDKVDNRKLYIFTDKTDEYIWLYRLDINQPITQSDLKRAENLALVKPDNPVLDKYIQMLYKVGNTTKARKFEKVLKTFYTS